MIQSMTVFHSRPFVIRRPALRRIEVRQIHRASLNKSTSLIPETLEDMSRDEEFQTTQRKLEEFGQIQLTREERRARQRSLDALGIPDFSWKLKSTKVSPLIRSPVKIFQLNIGLYCNQACSHCHVESSPMRTEMMDRKIADRCIELMKNSNSVDTVDLTGGAPELNLQFRHLVTNARSLGLEVIDRCNLTVLLEPDQEDLVEFLAKHQVRVVASLPCYSEENVNEQRGRGVFERSILGLRKLNEAGYGIKGTGLELDLVYNPNGAFLAPDQSTLEAAYREELKESYNIQFTRLLCLNNMPIKRFADYLLRQRKLKSYMELLTDNFNAQAAEKLMCRDTISVSWAGHIYDCDFNQQLALHAKPPYKRNDKALTIFDLNSLDDMTGWDIAYDNHCYGCTAGSGCGCQGALDSKE
eukprot:g4202.t1